VPECQKIKKDGLDQYGAEHFGRLIFATVTKSVGLKGLTHQHLNEIIAPLFSVGIFMSLKVHAVHRSLP